MAEGAEEARDGAEDGAETSDEEEVGALDIEHEIVLELVEHEIVLELDSVCTYASRPVCSRRGHGGVAPARRSHLNLRLFRR